MIQKLIVGLYMLTFKDVWLMSFKTNKVLIAALRKTSSGVRPLFKNKKIYLFSTIPPMRTQAFKRYLSGIRKLLNGNSVPLEVHLSVTDRCNYSCDRCSNFKTGTEPTFEEIKSIIKKLDSAGTATISFTGGDPALREDLPEIIALCKDTISTIVYTTGQGLDYHRLLKLKESGLDKLYVSLDHYDDKIHNKIRRNNNAFKQALDVIEISTSLNIYTVAQAVPDHALCTHDEIEKYLRFVKKIGVDEVMLLDDTAVKNESNCSMSDDQTYRDMRANLQIYYANRTEFPRVSAMSFFESKEYAGCQAGFSFCYINSNGEIFPCDFVPLSFGNIHTDNVDLIFERFKKNLKHPSAHCLAVTCKKCMSEDYSLPANYIDTEKVLKDYSPGERPALSQ